MATRCQVLPIVWAGSPPWALTQEGTGRNNTLSRPAGVPRQSAALLLRSKPPAKRAGGSGQRERAGRRASAPTKTAIYPRFQAEV